MRDVRADPRLRLVTIPFSHYCEKARWALDRVGVRYVEEPHAPLFHYPFTLLRGGGRTVPVLVTPTGVLADSTDILHYADSFARDGERLYPEDPPARREVEELEDRFDRELGAEARLWGYHQLLPRGDLAVRMLRGGTPWVEGAALPFVFPLARALIWRAVAITDERAARALRCVEGISRTSRRGSTARAASSSAIDSRRPTSRSRRCPCPSSRRRKRGCPSTTRAGFRRP
jgi:glutathione S-transferase